MQDFSNSWPSLEAGQHLRGSKLDLDLTRMATPSRGSVDPPEDQHLGDHETRTVTITMVAKAAVAAAAAAVAQLLGPGIAANVLTTTTEAMDTTVDSRTVATEALPPQGLPLGSKHKLLGHSSSTEAILEATLGTRQWAPLLALELPRPPRPII